MEKKNKKGFCIKCELALRNSDSVGLCEYCADKEYERLTAKTPPKYEGKIEPLRDTTPFYMVVVAGDRLSIDPVVYKSYEKAYEECLRLSKKENKPAYVVKSVTQVEQIPNVTQFKP